MDIVKDAAHLNCDLWLKLVGQRPDLAEKCRQGADTTIDTAEKFVKDPVGTVAGAVGNDLFDKILTNFWNGSVGVYREFITSWLKAGPIIDPQTSSAFQWGTGVVNIFTFLAVTIGIMVAGVKIVWEQRGEDIRYVLSSLGRVILVSGMGVTIISLLLTASDQAAAAILESSSWSSRDTTAILGDPSKAVAALGAMLFLPGAIMVLVVIVQWCIMILVAIATPVLLMYWPVAEGITFAAGGRGFSRVSKWLLAFILFKPTVAVLYGFAFQELKGGDGIGGIVTAVCIIAMAPFALPALLKIVNPAAAGTGADGAGTALAGMAGMAVGAAGMAAGAATGGAGAAAAAGGSSGASASAFMISNMGPTLAESGGMAGLGGGAAGAAGGAASGGGSGAVAAGGSSAGASGGSGAIAAGGGAPAASSSGGSGAIAAGGAPAASSGGSAPAPAAGGSAQQAPGGGMVGIGLTVSAGSDTSAAPGGGSGGGGSAGASRLAQAAQVLENHMPRAEHAEEVLLDEQSLDRIH
jgi:type IV secretion system protein TrbL